MAIVINTPPLEICTTNARIYTMATNKKAKSSPRRVAARAEKLIKVSPEVHRALKVQAAKRGRSIGNWVGWLANDGDDDNKGK